MLDNGKVICVFLSLFFIRSSCGEIYPHSVRFQRIQHHIYTNTHSHSHDCTHSNSPKANSIYRKKCSVWFFDCIVCKYAITIYLFPQCCLFALSPYIHKILTNSFGFFSLVRFWTWCKSNTKPSSPIFAWESSNKLFFSLRNFNTQHNPIFSKSRSISNEKNENYGQFFLWCFCSRFIQKYQLQSIYIVHKWLFPLFGRIFFFAPAREYEFDLLAQVNWK